MVDVVIKMIEGRSLMSNVNNIIDSLRGIHLTKYDCAAILLQMNMCVPYYSKYGEIIRKAFDQVLNLKEERRLSGVKNRRWANKLDALIDGRRRIVTWPNRRANHNYSTNGDRRLNPGRRKVSSFWDRRER